jgi:hypothetical protein
VCPEVAEPTQPPSEDERLRDAQPEQAGENRTEEATDEGSEEGLPGRLTVGNHSSSWDRTTKNSVSSYCWLYLREVFAHPVALKILT